jgi:transposase
VDAAVSSLGRRHAGRGRDDRQFRREGSPRLGRRQRGAAAQAIGRSRGGRTTKIHAICDRIGRLLVFALSPGNVADITVAPNLLAAAPTSAIFLADQGYDARAFRQSLAARGARAVIPNNPTRKHPHPFDPQTYRMRNAVERMFCRIKDGRRISTRYDKLARNFASSVALVATVLWWT